MDSLLSSLLIVALLVSCVLFGTAPAEGQIDCSAATTTASMQTCATDRYRAAEQELVHVVAQLNRKLDAAGRLRFHNAQVAWLHFRDANADFLADAARGGTLAPVLRMTALADMTEARSKELKQALQP